VVGNVIAWDRVTVKPDRQSTTVDARIDLASAAVSERLTTDSSFATEPAGRLDDSARHISSSRVAMTAARFALQLRLS
jgi:hypothetical protein